MERSAAERGGARIGFGPAEKLREHLEELYRRYHRPEFIGSDPLVIPLEYEAGLDRELAGLIAAWFSSGRARSIIEKSRQALELLTLDGRDDLSDVIQRCDVAFLLDRLGDFRYRWVGSDTLAASLVAVGKAISDHGSVLSALELSMDSSHRNIFPALSDFVQTYEAHATSILSECGGSQSAQRSLHWLWANPGRGAAAKRWMMWLRWFVRKDAVDPGGCTLIAPSHLVVPLDTHVFRLSRFMGLTSRRTPNQKTALEITDSLKQLCPEDPLRYDFALSRVGILGHCPGKRRVGVCEPCALFAVCRA